jgi:hypothetical protein
MSTTTEAERAANARWAARRRRLIGYGQWEPFVPSAPVRAHVRAVQAQGMAYRAIEQALDLPACAFKHLMWGTNGREPSEKVRKETADAVLAFWPSLDDFPDPARIDPTGTRRRVQALATLGWTNLYLASRVGIAPSNFRRALCQERVTAWFARSVRTVYNELWSRSPEYHEVPAGMVVRTVRTAQRKNWLGPLAWDDDTIDNPQAEPQTDAVQPIASEGGNVAARWLMGESVLLGREDRREVLAHLFEWTNDTTAEIAARLEMTPAAAERQWERMKERAAAEGRRLWRRVYVPRERTMNQDEMEEAA